MKQGTLDAYNRFLQTGKIADYLCYLDVKDAGKPLLPLEEMEEQSAYHDRGDRPATASDG